MPKTFRPLGELAVEQAIHAGLADTITFRCPKPLAVTLRKQGLAHQCEVSSVIRTLLQEALEARGIDWLHC